MGGKNDMNRNRCLLYPARGYLLQYLIGLNKLTLPEKKEDIRGGCLNISSGFSEHLTRIVNENATHTIRRSCIHTRTKTRCFMVYISIRLG